MSGAEVVKEPKSDAGRRTITVPGNVIGPLKDHLNQFTESNPDAYLLPIGNKVITRWRNRAREAIGRCDLRFHDLRHNGLTLAAATRATTADLMHRGGHSSPAAALRYQHATADQDRVLADALADLATNAKVIPIVTRDSRATGA